MLVDMFSWFDSSLAAVLPDAARIVCWGGLSGVLSMLMYWWTSPQKRLHDLKAQTVDLQKQLADYDGDFTGAMALTRQNLAVSLRRLGWALVPALVAGAPVLLVLVGVADVYSGQRVLSFGPAWLQSWISVFFAATTVAALATKFVCRIE